MINNCCITLALLGLLKLPFLLGPKSQNLLQNWLKKFHAYKKAANFFKNVYLYFRCPFSFLFFFIRMKLNIYVFQYLRYSTSQTYSYWKHECNYMYLNLILIGFLSKPNKFSAIFLNSIMWTRYRDYGDLMDALKTEM